MTAINHAMTGALIGVVVGQPVIAIPAALLSHFICDALPHYDSEPAGARVKTQVFLYYLVADTTLCFLLVVLLAVTQPAHWQLAAICAFVATSPDLLWVNRYLRVNQKRSWRPNAFLRFASAIQWFAKPIGAVVEVAWFVGTVVLMTPYLR